MRGSENFGHCFIPAMLLAAVFSLGARGDETVMDSPDAAESPQQMARELRDMKAEIRQLHQEVQELKVARASDAATQVTQTAKLNGGAVTATNPDASVSAPLVKAPPSVQSGASVSYAFPTTAASEMMQPLQPATQTPRSEFGYDNGFFVQTPDKDYSLHISALTQVRYTFADDAPRDTSEFPTPPKTGDANGFDFRFARIYFFGNAIVPNLTYMIMGDFATDSGNVNNYQLIDDYVAWRFNDAFNIRAGAYLVPFSRVEYNVSGEALIDFPEVEIPFDPARSFGVSVFGTPVKDKLTYEFMINNGPSANHNGRAAQVGGLTDNRLGLASRWQLFGGSGKPADFTDESDLRNDKNSLAWMLGAAIGYDSLNQSSDAFPGKQVYSIPGVASLTTPGFVSYPVNGDLYRATMDGEIKYKGWEFTGATYFEQINATPTTGVTLPSGYADKTSFFNFAYYGQVGYMFLPKWEIVGRAGQYYTEGGSNHMDEFSLGINYFIKGQNIKLQSDFTYIPDAAFTNSVDGTSQSTADFIARTQLQVKF